MSTQSDYEKNRNAALDTKKKVTNQREKDNVKKNAAKAIKLYGDKIRQIQTINIKPAKQEIAILETTIAIRKRQYNDEYRTRLPLNSTDISILENDPTFGSKGTAVFEKQVLGYKTRINTAEKEITEYKEKIKEQRRILDGKKPEPPAKKSSGKGGANVNGSEVIGGNVTFTKNYKYNAPMVKSAYFTSAKGLSSSLVGVTNDGNFVDQGAYADAMRAWTGTTGGRGTIQMDRQFTTNLAQNLGGANANLPLDPQMYGFKFLYNPKEVAMAWGVMDKMDPSYIASGSEVFNVISAGLMSATITVTILLNRIHDFSYIDANGFKSGVSNDAFLEDADQRLVARNRGLLQSPYPEYVSPEDLQDIYRKGTMYDIEYLFRTINGPHATFVSRLNGKTADRGWLRPSLVELHLGAGMRYRVRLAQFAVTHSVFNSRMVPILSSVQLTFGRFNDGPETSTGTNAAYGATNRPLYQPGGTRLP
jgi:hypothetical protein